MSVERAWADIRSSRSDRPGEAGIDASRGETYTAALEQAEQLFTAARGVGPATSPLLLFYGISQLGRALAAASPRLSMDEYRLKGDGITSRESSWSNGRIDDVLASADSGRNPKAFQRVAQVVGACAFERQPRQLAELINLVSVLDSDIEESLRLPKYPPLSFSSTADDDGLPRMSVGPGTMSVFVAGVPRSVIPHESRIALDELLEPDPEWPGNTGRDRLTNFFDSYPTIQGWKLSTNELDALVHSRFLPPRHDVMQILLTLPLNEDEPSLPTPARYFSDGVAVAMACPDGWGMPDHPLTLWWALLHSLSMLARYAP